MIEEKILTPILELYINTENLSQLEKGIFIKERVDVIRNMEILIYTRDHLPAHFHVKSKDSSINAKFLIEDGSFLSGDISPKDLKRIKAFYTDIKSKMVWEMWNKRNK